MKNKLYRYKIEYKTYDNETDVVLREYPVIRETEYNYFINIGSFVYPKEKKVKKDAMSTFAFDTKEKAKEHFIRRTEQRVRWYRYWIEECEKGLELIEANSKPLEDREETK